MDDLCLYLSVWWEAVSAHIYLSCETVIHNLGFNEWLNKNCNVFIQLSNDIMIEIKFNLCQIVFISLLVISCLSTTKMIVNRFFWVLGNEDRSTPTTSSRTWTTSQLAGRTGTLFSIWMEVFITSSSDPIPSKPLHNALCRYPHN